MNMIEEEIVLNDRMKKCSTCEKVLSKENFYKNSQTKDKLAYSCRRCENIKKKGFRDNDPSFKEKHKKRGHLWYLNNKEGKLKKNREWIENNPAQYRELNLKYRFGITTEIYNNILEKQDNSCAICKKHKDNFNYFLVVDHCHKTGNIRGILCRKCNLGIGHLNDNIDILKNSIFYLEQFK